MSERIYPSKRGHRVSVGYLDEKLINDLIQMLKSRIPIVPDSSSLSEMVLATGHSTGNDFFLGIDIEKPFSITLSFV